MKTIDNTIKYYELLMCYNDTSKYIEYELPEGFHYEFYKDGDEADWINIHISSGEFMSASEGQKVFHDFYDSFITELNKRCIFIINDVTNEKVGTATVSLLKNEEHGYKAAIDWVAIKSEYQGRKLARPLISRFIKLANELGHNSVILHTQTITWLAAKLYLDAGVELLNPENEIGWRILKRLTNHEKLNVFDNATDEEMYDTLSIEIKRQLDMIYGVDNYNFSVWYTKGRHDVATLCNGKTDYYKYYVESNSIRLEKVDKLYEE